MIYFIYKIVCNDTDIKDCYVGSTNNLKRRSKDHKSNCNNSKYNYKVYKFIRENGGWDNWTVVKIKELDCSKEEKLLEERKYVEEIGTLNMLIPSRTKKESLKEYRLKNKDKAAKYIKAYQIKNKDKINKRNRERRAAKKLQSYHNL